MNVEYFDNGKHAVFNGMLFCRDDKTGYYLNSNTSTRLHRAVWEFHNGRIPEGSHVHHRDHDKNNNELDNLVLVTAAEHRHIHAEEMPETTKKKLRQNLLKNAMPKAAEWHGTSEGKEWHKKHYEKMKDHLYEKRMFVCEECGKTFEAAHNGNNRFCSNACKSNYRRKSGVDNENRKCEWCGEEFTTNKYSKRRTCSRSCRNKLRWSKICAESRT